MVGEEILDRETQLKRKLTPLEKSKVLEETVKLYVTNDGDNLSEFQRRMAECRGFIDVPGQGLVRKNADGSYERYDPSQPYDLPSLGEGEGEGEEPPGQPEPLQPLPERGGRRSRSPPPPGEETSRTAQLVASLAAWPSRRLPSCDSGARLKADAYRQTSQLQMELEAEASPELQHLGMPPFCKGCPTRQNRANTGECPMKTWGRGAGDIPSASFMDTVCLL